MGSMYDDKELVSKVLEGNKGAYELLVKQYERLVYHIINRIVLNNEVTKDLCQDVFIKVYMKLGDFQFNSKLSTWIATIAYHLALNHLKKEKRMRVDNLADVADEALKAEVLSPLDWVEEEDTQQFVHKLIGKLPVQYKTVLTLYHLNEFTYKEIYEITGWPEGTVKNYLFRARQLLKEALKEKEKAVGSVSEQRFRPASR